MLLNSSLDHLRKVKKLTQSGAVHEVIETLRPATLILDKNVNQIAIVFQLRVNNFDILIVFSKKLLEVLKSSFDTLG